jgi:hypothetical protein
MYWLQATHTAIMLLQLQGVDIALCIRQELWDTLTCICTSISTWTHSYKLVLSKDELHQIEIVVGLRTKIMQWTTWHIKNKRDIERCHRTVIFHFVRKNKVTVHANELVFQKRNQIHMREWAVRIYSIQVGEIWGPLPHVHNLLATKRYDLNGLK